MLCQALFSIVLPLLGEKENKNKNLPQRAVVTKPEIIQLTEPLSLHR